MLDLVVQSHAAVLFVQPQGLNEGAKAMPYLAAYLYVCGAVLYHEFMRGSYAGEQRWRAYLGAMMWPVVVPLSYVTRKSDN